MDQQYTTLTERQIHLIELSADGKLYREIADEWGIREGSVRNMAHKAFQRIGADNMNQAIAMCFRRRIIE